VWKVIKGKATNSLPERCIWRTTKHSTPEWRTKSRASHLHRAESQSFQPLGKSVLPRFPPLQKRSSSNFLSPNYVPPTPKSAAYIPQKSKIKCRVISLLKINRMLFFLTAINPRITTSTALYIIRPTPKPFFLIHLKKQTIGTNFSSLLLKEKKFDFYQWNPTIP